jgi:predicted MFS family arabinose efflux permease
VAGVAAANLAGRLADQRRTQRATLLAAVFTLGAYGALAFGRSSLAALLVGIVALDVGEQSMHITSQAVIYEAVPGARSRVNSAYMTCFFAGGAVASSATGAVFAADGWTGVCALGAGFAALALSMALRERRRALRQARRAT